MGRVVWAVVVVGVSVAVVVAVLGVVSGVVPGLFSLSSPSLSLEDVEGVWLWPRSKEMVPDRYFFNSTHAVLVWVGTAEVDLKDGRVLKFPGVKYEVADFRRNIDYVVIKFNASGREYVWVSSNRTFRWYDYPLLDYARADVVSAPIIDVRSMRASFRIVLFEARLNESSLKVEVRPVPAGDPRYGYYVRACGIWCEVLKLLGLNCSVEVVPDPENYSAGVWVREYDPSTGWLAINDAWVRYRGGKWVPSDPRQANLAFIEVPAKLVSYFTYSAVAVCDGPVVVSAIRTSPEERPYIYFYSVIAHEVGHALRLPHPIGGFREPDELYLRIVRDDVMNPDRGVNRFTVTFVDVIQLVKRWGIPLKSELLTPLGIRAPFYEAPRPCNYVDPTKCPVDYEVGPFWYVLSQPVLLAEWNETARDIIVKVNPEPIKLLQTVSANHRK